MAAGGSGFGFVAGGGPGRRALGGGWGDAEGGLGGEDLGDPGLVGGVIGGDAPFGTGLEDAGDEGDLVGVDEAALGVAGFGPGVGEHEEELVEAGVGEGAQDHAGVVGPETEVFRQGGGGLGAFGDEAGEEGADAVFEHFAGDDGGFGVLGDLGVGVFAAAEADLEPELGVGGGESGGGVGSLGFEEG